MAPEAWQIRVRTGTRRRLEPRYLIIGGPHGGHGGPPYDGRSWCLGTIQRAGRMGVRVGLRGRRRGGRARTGCGGTRPTRTRRRTCRCACGRCSRWCGAALDEMPVPAAHPEPIRMVSLCAGQGRDVIDVVATHPRGASVSALLVELDPALAPSPGRGPPSSGWPTGSGSSRGTRRRRSLYTGRRAGRHRAGVRGLREHQRGGHHAHHPGDAGILRSRGATSCGPGTGVPPDHTPAIRADFAAAGFTELGFEAPDGSDSGRGPSPPRWADGALRPRPAAVRIRRRRWNPA